MNFEPALSPKVESPPSWLILICGKQILVSQCSTEVLFPADSIESLNIVFQHRLGAVNQQHLDAFVIDNTEELSIEGWEWANLRDLLGVLHEPLFHLAGRALQFSYWDKTHRYCGQCGGATIPADEYRSRMCTRCELHFYPRLSPCVIGLIHDGKRCLLARNVRHPAGRFSTIAGFIEPGETAEQAFAREVREEVGVQVKNIRYAFSQPWPFPGQLMLGFYAEYAGGEIQVDNIEIIEADWFDIDNLPQTPPESTISGLLIREYVQKVREQK